MCDKLYVYFIIEETLEYTNGIGKYAYRNTEVYSSLKTMYEGLKGRGLELLQPFEAFKEEWQSGDEYMSDNAYLICTTKKVKVIK